MQKETISFSVDREHRGIGTVARSNSHRLWRVQDLTMLARDPLLPLAVLSSSARVVTWQTKPGLLEKPNQSVPDAHAAQSTEGPTMERLEHKPAPVRGSLWERFHFVITLPLKSPGQGPSDKTHYR